MVEKFTLNYLATALVDIPAVTACQMHCSLNLRHLWHCVVRQNVHVLEWPFIVHSTMCTCVMIMPFNQLIYATTVKWMDYLGKVM